MHDLALILLAAAVAHFLAAILKVSAVPLLIISGITLSVSGLMESSLQLKDTLLLGLAFLVFLAGTELNPTRIGKQLPPAIKVGILQFFILALASFGLARLADLPFISALYFSLAIAASSTLVIVRILQQRRQIFEPFGRLVLGVLLLQDILVIILISLFSNLDSDWLTFGAQLAGLIGLGLLSIIFQRYIAHYFFVKLKLDEETLLLTSLAVLFLFGFIAHIIGLPFVVGAFLGGFALSSFPVHGIVQSQLLSLSDFFIAIFFVCLGSILVMPSWSDLWLVVATLSVILVLTPLLVLLIAERANLTTRSAIEAGLLLAQTSEFSLVLGLIGLEAGYLGEKHLSVIALVTVVTMILTPLLATDRITWKLTRLRPYRSSKPNEMQPPKVLLLGCGESTLNLLTYFDENIKSQIRVIDYDPSVIHQLEELNIEAYRGDAADFRTLKSNKARQANLIISTLNSTSDNLNILRFLKNQNVLIRVSEDLDAAKVKNAGGKVLITSEQVAQKLLEQIIAS